MFCLGYFVPLNSKNAEAGKVELASFWHGGVGGLDHSNCVMPVTIALGVARVRFVVRIAAFVREHLGTRFLFMGNSMTVPLYVGFG